MNAIMNNEMYYYLLSITKSSSFIICEHFSQLPLGKRVKIKKSVAVSSFHSFLLATNNTLK